MPAKKIGQRQNITTTKSNSYEFNKRLNTVLNDVQQKVNNSPALNGGFDTLLYKIENIEGNQEKIVNRVDEIHDAIYAPDDGLFSRIASIKSNATEDRQEIEKKLIEFTSWKDQTDKSVTKHSTDESVIITKFEEQQKLLDEVIKWKSTFSSVIKWIFVALGGGIVTLIFKILYVSLTAHLK